MFCLRVEILANIWYGVIGGLCPQENLPRMPFPPTFSSHKIFPQVPVSTDPTRAEEIIPKSLYPVRRKSMWIHI